MPHLSIADDIVSVYCRSYIQHPPRGSGTSLLAPANKTERGVLSSIIAYATTTTSGGRLFVIGLQPIPGSDKFSSSCTGDGDVFCRITKVRDACILLANHRCYREYPLEWITRQMNRIPTLHVTSTKQFPINL